MSKARPLALLAALLGLPGCRESHTAPLDAKPREGIVALESERALSGAPRVTLRNLTDQPRQVDLRALAYAGSSSVRVGQNTERQEQWRHWWTEEGLLLRPHGAWTATLYPRLDKLQVIDGRGTLVAERDFRYEWPPMRFNRVAILHSDDTWRPAGRMDSWLCITPADLAAAERTPDGRADFERAPIRVIGDVSPGALSARQIGLLRRAVMGGRTLVIAGGNLRRLLEWHREGLLAAPVIATRSIPSLDVLEARYGEQLPPTPVTAAQLGPLPSDARVLVAQGAVPLVVERPYGLGRLVLITFDALTGPTHGWAAEPRLWAECVGREFGDWRSVVAGIEQAPVYKRIAAKAGVDPPDPRLIAGMGAAYLVILTLAASLGARRARNAMVCVGAGTFAAFASPLMLRGTGTSMGYAGVHLRQSGQSGGVWRGRATVVTAAAGTHQLSAEEGRLDLWSAPTTLREGEGRIAAHTPFVPWRQALGFASIAEEAAGETVELRIELQGSAVMAAVRNRSRRPLTKPIVLWDHAALVRLEDVPRGGEAHKPIGRVMPNGAFVGALEPAPKDYGPLSGWGNSPDAYNTPMLLAGWPGAPPPSVLADGRKLNGRGVDAILVSAPSFALRGPALIPAEAVSGGVVGQEYPMRLLRPTPGTGIYVGEIRGWCTVELKLPHGTGRYRSKQFVADFQSNTALLEVDALVAGTSRWLSLGITRGTTSRLAIPTQAIDPVTDSILLKLTNSAIGLPGSVTINLHGEVDGPPPSG